MSVEEKREAKRAYLRKYNRENKEKKAAQNKEWRAANAEAIKAKKREAYQANKAAISAKNKAARLVQSETYGPAERAKRSAAARVRNSGFTPVTYAAALNLQGHACAICSADLRALPPHRVHADHCHETNTPRGVLCASCNMAIGLMKDSVERLLAAVRYLQSPPLGIV